MTRDLQGGRRAARRALDELDAVDLCATLVGVPSPTGRERHLAEQVQQILERYGVRSSIQRLSSTQANLVASLDGDGSGPDLALVAGLDTAFSGDPTEDEPWLGPSPRRDFRPDPITDGDTIVGLGAENPKGLATAGVLALVAIAKAEVELRGQLVVALTGGSMPLLAHGSHQHVGFGRGVDFMLDRGFRPDYAVILKPGDNVGWREVGQCWFRITVKGNVAYTGARHKTTYDNPLLKGAELIERLDHWMTDEYTPRHTGGLLAPQGSVTAFRGGSERRGVFSPSYSEIYVDLRTTPESDGIAVQREFMTGAARCADDVGASIDIEPIVALDASHTEPEDWIVRETIAAWERISEAEHVPSGSGSSASDAGRLRRRGIPTAKIGLRRSSAMDDYPGLSMGVVDGEAIRRLAAILIDVALETCTRTRGETQRRGIETHDEE